MFEKLYYFLKLSCELNPLVSYQELDLSFVKFSLVNSQLGIHWLCLSGVATFNIYSFDCYVCITNWWY